MELDITIKNGMLIHKLFDKRDAFPFPIVRMPDLSGNIPKHIFYGSIGAEMLRIARATLLFEDFVTKGKELSTRMIKQGGARSKISRCINKIFERHPDAFSSFKQTSIQIKHSILP